MMCSALFPASTRILFIGDSITDGDRSRTGDINHSLGDTYVRLIAARYGADHAEDAIEFINRGINGDRITDLAARWEQDCLELKPNILSIFVGVNDAASCVEQIIPPAPRTDGRPPKSLVTLELFERTYDDLLSETRKRLPNVRILLCTPFVLPVGKIGENWELWASEVGKRTEVITNLASRHGGALVNYQPLFDSVLTLASAEFWIPDGVHPSAAGHQLMADEWLRIATLLRDH